MSSRYRRDPDEVDRGPVAHGEEHQEREALDWPLEREPDERVVEGEANGECPAERDLHAHLLYSEPRRAELSVVREVLAQPQT